MLISPQTIKTICNVFQGFNFFFRPIVVILPECNYSCTYLLGVEQKRHRQWKLQAFPQVWLSNNLTQSRCLSKLPRNCNVPLLSLKNIKMPLLKKIKREREATHGRHKFFLKKNICLGYFCYSWLCSTLQFFGSLKDITIWLIGQERYVYFFLFFTGRVV